MTDQVAFVVDDDKLPANFRTGKPIETSLLSPSKARADFIVADLCVNRISKIEEYLWLAGKPYPPRSLSTQIVLDRIIIPTNEASLHLVWTTKKIFLKPLPSYIILSRSFYDQYLRPPKPSNPAALGFLYTYLALLPTELDFALAQEHHLIPSNLAWEDWKATTARVLDHYPGYAIYKHLPQRYIYGELRLSRLDKVYRYLRGSWLHGYSSLTSSTQYSDFLTANLGPIAAATAYIVVVLAAMQLGVATKGLGSSSAFNRACYGFTVFSIIAPVAGLLSVLLASVVIFFANWRSTMAVENERFRRMGIPAHKPQSFRGLSRSSGITSGDVHLNGRQA